LIYRNAHPHELVKMQQPCFSFFAGLSLQHSLLLDFAATCSGTASVVCGAVATFAGSALEAPPQHEPDMIDLQYFIYSASSRVHVDAHCDKSRT